MAWIATLLHGRARRPGRVPPVMGKGRAFPGAGRRGVRRKAPEERASERSEALSGRAPTAHSADGQGVGAALPTYSEKYSGGTRTRAP
ncbi:hypothetical protein HD593_009621 [Nonomuraea rubra]|uniref:Uncharacterized protein n=1 Tax=Nonomuraea rubra TaxID=46180 RepID=A0A7X0P4A8_9ACTN|nr:hypothetical protein [Nonomuraea rubra]